MNENNLVTKANQLVSSHYSLSLEELRIILTLISSVQPEDEEFHPYEFKITEFIEMLGINDPSKYTELPKITKGLMKKVFEIKEGNIIKQIAWFYYAEYNKGTGTITLKFAPELKPYLLGLKQFFTTYRLANILTLNSKYSIRLYEILKSNEYRKVIVIKLDELMDMLRLSKSYLEYQNIKNRIIKPAQQELAEKTDITFDYETITVRKKVTALKFTIKSNKKNATKESSSQLTLPEPTNKTHQDIKTIKNEFKRLYNAELLDKFVKEMIDVKGFEHVLNCVKSFKEYIKGKKVTSVGGFFTSFVLNDYVKPVSLDATPRQYPIFEISPEERERQEKIARGEPVAPTANPEIAKASLKSMKEILGMRQK